MAGQDNTEVEAITGLVAAEDEVRIVDSPSGTPQSKRIVSRLITGRTLLDEADLSTAGTVNFTSIDNGYSRLRLRGYLRGERAGTTVEVVNMEFNADTTAANYVSQRFDRNSDSDNWSIVADNTPAIALITAATATTDFYAPINIVIEDYADTTTWTTSFSHYILPETASITRAGQYSHFYEIQGAISSIQLEGNTTANMTGYVRLYGEY